jgi:hypothetical protein
MAENVVFLSLQTWLERSKITCEMARPLRIAIIAYDGVQALDIVGPADAFAAAVI